MSRTEEEVRAQMFKDFTFKPAITKLPAKIYGHTPSNDRDTPFYERVTKWKKDRDAHLHKQKSDVEGDKVAECTFKPRLNRNSVKAVEEIRLDGDESDKNVVERLQKKGEMAQIHRSSQEQAEYERVRAEEKKYCTFTPQLTRSNLKKFNNVKSKYLNYSEDNEFNRYGNSSYRSISRGARSVTSEINSLPGDHPDRKHCTFTPNIKGICSYMNSAKLYVSTGVVDRLTRPASASSNISIADGAISMNNNETSFGYSSSSYQQFNSSFRSQSVNGQRRKYTDEEIRERKAKFQQFISRQAQIVRRKERKVEEIKRSTTPTFHPSFTRKSYELMDQMVTGEFLTRVERDLMKRDDNKVREIIEINTENTFKPKINERSEKLRPRSLYELYRGDALKSMSYKRLMKTRAEQEEQNELTFRPEISELAKNKINKNTVRDPVVVWQQKLEQQKLKLEQKKLEEETNEKKECTFVPKYKKCPQYMKRIAMSMAAIRETRKREQDGSHKANRPGWK